MSLDLSRILESKRIHRARLAALPIAEKLRMLDAMRERALVLRGVAPGMTSIIREESVSYGSDGGKERK